MVGKGKYKATGVDVDCRGNKFPLKDTKIKFKSGGVLDGRNKYPKQKCKFTSGKWTSSGDVSWSLVWSGKNYSYKGKVSGSKISGTWTGQGGPGKFNYTITKYKSKHDN